MPPVRPPTSDPQETPAVPPSDPGGDERVGFAVAGGLLLALGWGMAVVLNVLLHDLAPSGGERILGLWFGHALGVYAGATIAFGAATGLFGIVLLAYARGSPRGPLVLPGAEY